VTAWYPVSLAVDLAPGEVTGTRLLGHDIVLWRDAAGQPHAWEDRCPHRGMRLSFGFVRDGRLACLYHGWRYDSAGRCRAIPAHPELSPPATIRVPRHACAEACGLIWASAEPTEDPPPPPADAPAQPIRSLFLPLAAAAAATLAAGEFGDQPELRLGAQPRDAASCVLHAVWLGDALPTAERIGLARRLAWLRRRVEAG
jgi:phenylpropionate dioxygenase-like ring-hydroxylating dioxygenase large terminal subunit